jgi:hypothetical protein
MREEHATGAAEVRLASCGAFANPKPRFSAVNAQQNAVFAGGWTDRDLVEAVRPD